VTADNPFPADPVLKAGKLLFKCPTCPDTVSVMQHKIDPIIGVNVACSGCKNISHVPGGFDSEPRAPGMRITGGVRVPIARFSDWYYENPLIASLIQTGQSDLLNDHGLWAFCGACYHQYPATVLTSLVIAQSMAQRGAGGFMFTARTPGSAKDMDALRSGHCSHCRHKELIVIATEIPDNVRNGIPKSKNDATTIAADKAPRQKVNFRGAIGAKAIITIVAIGSIVALLYWAMVSLPGQQNQAGAICWTYELKQFGGTRSQAWDKFLDNRTRKLLPYNQFIVDVVLHNPQLKDDGYVFLRQKNYILPELCR
jgi:hypothetical protein